MLQKLIELNVKVVRVRTKKKSEIIIDFADPRPLYKKT